MSLGRFERVQGAQLLLGAILMGSLALNATGLNWGLPSMERLRMVFPTEASLKIGVQKARDYVGMDLWQTSSQTLVNQMKPEVMAHRGVFNAVRSYHPDEQIYLKVLAQMNPSQWDFNPRYFANPAFFIYSVGVGIKLASWMGWAKLIPDPVYYLQHPHEMARFYLVGRMLSVVYAFGIVYMTYRLGRVLFDTRTGLLAMTMMAVMPVLVVNAHYMKMDIPTTFWTILALYLMIPHEGTHSQGIGRSIAAGVAAGLAFGTKYTGGMLLVPLVGIHLLAGEGRLGMKFRNALRSRKLWGAMLAFWLSFLAINPYILVEPRLFFAHFATGLNIVMQVVVAPDVTVRHSVDETWVGKIANNVVYTAGWEPLFLAGLIGLLWFTLQSSWRMKALMLYALPWLFFAVISQHKVASYVLPVMPALVVAGAGWLRRLYARAHGWHRGMLVGSVIAMLLYSLFVSLAYVQIFSREDVRDEAGRWIREHVAEGKSIGLMNFNVAFRSVPLSIQGYRIEPMQMGRSRWDAEYLLATEWDYAKRHWAELQRARRDDLLARIRGAGYREVARFERPLAIWGIRLPQWPLASDDLLHPRPTVHLFQKQRDREAELAARGG